MTAERDFRTDIQGLRALAVSLVLVFHLWPAVLPGGYVGVDVFFVISGFLITGHLLSEVKRYGAIATPVFWARRIRRLLPAAFFVLFVCALLTLAFLPGPDRVDTFREIVASAFYVENWALIGRSVDYLAVGNEPSLVQHYWSLSVEEQFYFCWPLLIMFALALKRRATGTRAATGTDPGAVRNALLLVLLASLACSVLGMDYLGQGQAYFSTATRAWEFALGGLLNFVPAPVVRPQLPHRPACAVNTLSWLGFLLVVCSALAFSADTDFPGIAALLPTSGTALIIAAQGGRSGWSFAAATRFRPVQLLGDISYSVYLWHWPLIVILPFVAPGRYDSPLAGTLIIVATLVLAWFTRFAIEEPALRSERWLQRPAFSYAFALSGMLCIASAATVFSLAQSGMPRPAVAQSAGFESGAVLRQLLASTLAADGWGEIDQYPGRQAQAPEWVVDHCDSVDIDDPASLARCAYGNPAANRRLVLIGDSWATHFIPAIRKGFSDDWRIQVLTLSQCPVANVAVHEWGKREEFERCRRHRARTLEWIVNHRPDLVIASDSPVSTASRLMSGNEGEAAIREIIAGLADSYGTLRRAGIDVVHLESPPRANCLFRKTGRPGECSPAPDTPFQRRISEAKLALAGSLGITAVDTTFWFCSKALVCPNQIGNMLVKADTGHLAGNMSRRIGRILHQEVVRDPH